MRLERTEAVDFRPFKNRMKSTRRETVDCGASIRCHTVAPCTLGLAMRKASAKPASFLSVVSTFEGLGCVEVTHQQRWTGTELFPHDLADPFHLTFVSACGMCGENLKRPERRREFGTEQDARVVPRLAARQLIDLRGRNGKAAEDCGAFFKSQQADNNGVDRPQAEKTRSVAGANTTCKPSARASRSGTLPCLRLSEAS